MNTLIDLMSALPAQVQPEKGIGLPRDVSLEGWRIDWLINITMVFVAILFVIMVIWMVAACIRYDEKHRALYDHGSAKKQVVFALSLSSLIFFVVDGNLFYNAMVDVTEAYWNFPYAESQPNAVRIEVNARQWAWQARYAGPDGEFNTKDDVLTLNDIRVPVNAPVIIQLAAVDVIHSMYLPNLRAKIDAVPGVINRLWFQAKETGMFDIGCAQHCGMAHYKMKGTLIVLSPEDYAAWLKEASANSALAFDPEDTGAQWGWPWKKEG
jgi:cytochrome c oxidase subunit II